MEQTFIIKKFALFLSRLHSTIESPRFVGSKARLDKDDIFSVVAFTR